MGIDDVGPFGDPVDPFCILEGDGLADVGEFPVFKNEEMVFFGDLRSLRPKSGVKSSRMSTWVFRTQIRARVGRPFQELVLRGDVEGEARFFFCLP